MKRAISLWLLLVSLCYVFVGCVKFGPSPDPADVTYTIEKVSEHRVIIYIEDVAEVNSIYGVQWMLADVMEDAKVCGELSYESSNGMITSINGVKNMADFSACWMLYTSDKELADNAWGTITIGEETIGSAMVGAESLPVLEGAIYVWEYTSF